MIMRVGHVTSPERLDGHVVDAVSVMVFLLMVVMTDTTAEVCTMVVGTGWTTVTAEFCTTVVVTVCTIVVAEF